MRGTKEAEVLIYLPASSQALAPIWMVVYPMNVAVQSEAARDGELNLQGVAVWSELTQGTRGALS